MKIHKLLPQTRFHRISLVVFRLLGLGIGLFWFIWQNIFYLRVSPTSYPNTVAQFFSFAGALYGVLLCGTFIRIGNQIVKRIYNVTFILLSIGVTIFLGLSTLWSLVFMETIPLFIFMELVNILLILTVLMNMKIVYKDIDVFKQKKFILFGILFIYICGLIYLTSQWEYLASPVSCRGKSMTTAGNFEPWQYVLPRFHCWQYKLWSTE